MFLARWSAKGLVDSLTREFTPCEDVEVNVMPAEDLLLVVVASLQPTLAPVALAPQTSVVWTFRMGLTL